MYLSMEVLMSKLIRQLAAGFGVVHKSSKSGNIFSVSRYEELKCNPKQSKGDTLSILLKRQSSGKIPYRLSFLLFKKGD